MMLSPRRSVSKRYKLDTSPFSRFWAHQKILKYVGENKKILDVGCATGYLAKEFKNNNCHVVGIELDKEAATVAEQYCDDVLFGDVEQISKLPYPDGFFDVMVYSDVLEHLKRPDLVLLRFKKYLSKSGSLIVSVPNIAYFAIRLKLLFGIFEYEEKGIFDITHLRFFTLNSIKRMLSGCGYRITKIDYTGPTAMIKILPRLLAVQFIIVAQRKG